MESLEMLQAIEQNDQAALTHLNQAVQLIEQVHTQFQEWSAAHAERHTSANPTDVMTAIQAINDQIHQINDQHNQVLGQINRLKEEAAAMPPAATSP